MELHPEVRAQLFDEAVMHLRDAADADKDRHFIAARVSLARMETIVSLIRRSLPTQE